MASRSSASKEQPKPQPQPVAAAEAEGPIVLLIPFYARPRCLYFTVFVWISITGGRFLAPFLEHNGLLLSSTQIGILLAVQQITALLTSNGAGQLADNNKWHQQQQASDGGGSGGREQVLAGGIVLGTVAFGLHGLSSLFSSSSSSSITTSSGTSTSNHDGVLTFAYYVLLRILYALGTSLVFPVLEGICLHHLGPDNKEDYGQERLWGAISWAITNLGMAPLFDHYGGGFHVLYPLALFSSIAVLVSLYVFARYHNNNIALNNQQQHYYDRLEKRDSNIVLQDDNDEGVISSQEKACGRKMPAVAVFDDIEKDSGNSVMLDERADIDSSSVHVQQEQQHEREIWTSRALLGKLLFDSNSQFRYFGLVFVLAGTLLSFGQVIVESLIFLFFETLGSNYITMGWTVVLTVLFEIPVFHISNLLLTRFGCNKLLQAAMVCYMVRVVGYSCIPPGQILYVLLLEPLHGITYACSQTAIVDYVAQHTPKDYEATGQGWVYVIRGVGAVLGLLYGGWAEDVLGPRVLYRSVALIVACGSIALGLARYQQQQGQTRKHLMRLRTESDEDCNVLDESVDKTSAPELTECCSSSSSEEEAVLHVPSSATSQPQAS